MTQSKKLDQLIEILLWAFKDNPEVRERLAALLIKEAKQGTKRETVKEMRERFRQMLTVKSLKEQVKKNKENK